MNRPFGLTEYFARNSVAANLLMIFIVLMGLISWKDIKRQLFSTTEINKISIWAEVPGASPEDIEESVTIKIEEALKSVEAIKRMQSATRKNYAYLELDVYEDEPVKPVIREIKLKLDAIASFPGNMEPIRIDRFHWNQSVVRLILTGPLDNFQFKELGDEIRNELLQLANVQVVDFLTLPNYEIGIEIKPEVLRQYQVNLDEIASQISNYSQNLSAGSIRTSASELFIRLESQSYRGDEFSQIPVIVGEQGQKLLLSDIAVIKDGFIESMRYSKFNGKSATSLHVYATEKESMPLVADSVYRYIEQKNTELPAGVQLQAFNDETRYLDERIDMMLGNLMQGAVLVFIALALFLRFRIALWVMLGLPVVLLGAVMMMYAFGILINVTTLFAFIMALGIVVDDAIVIGESAYSECVKRGHNIDNIVAGVKKVSTPVTFGILTTMAVFMPLLFAEGNDAGQFIDLSAVVILCLIFSLVESRLILPAHLAQGHWRPLPENHWRNRVDGRLKSFIHHRYIPFLQKCLNTKTFTISLFVVALVISIGLITSGNLKFVSFPKVAADTPQIRVVMNNLVSEQQTEQIMQRLEGIIHDSNKQAIDETGKPVVADILMHITERGRGEFMVSLVDESERPWDAFELSRRWYPLMSGVPGVYSINIQDEAIPNNSGGAIGFRFYGKDLDELNNAAMAMMEAMGQTDGVYNITSEVSPAVKELTFELKPVAHTLGLTPVNVAQQLNLGFYGFEAQRITREGKDIKVMVRYPQEMRAQRAGLRHARIFTPNGNEVLLGDVVSFKETQGTQKISREKGFRSVRVLADVDSNVTTANQVTNAIRKEVLPKIRLEFDGVKTSLAGAITERTAQRNQMVQFGMVAILLAFVLLAVPLKSYLQPLIILSVVPFSLIGAIWGHVLFGYNVSLFSLFGIIAAIGVVINDSLVLVSTINQLISQGMEKVEAVVTAAKSRFRPILLTSITTFVGLMPIMFESSLQGKFVAPMAISLAFALLVSTFTSLLLVPMIYLFGRREHVDISSEKAASALPDRELSQS